MKEKYQSLKPEMFHFEEWIPIIKPKVLKITFENFLVESKFKIVNFNEHFFPIEGYTCVWVLAESHLAIHTFPKNNTSYIQISSCNKDKLEIITQKINNLLS